MKDDYEDYEPEEYGSKEEKQLKARITTTEDSKIYEIQLEDGTSIHLDMFQGNALTFLELSSNSSFENKFIIDRRSDDKKFNIRIENDDKSTILETSIVSTESKQEETGDDSDAFF